MSYAGNEHFIIGEPVWMQYGSYGWSARFVVWSRVARGGWLYGIATAQHKPGAGRGRRASELRHRNPSLRGTDKPTPPHKEQRP